MSLEHYRLVDLYVDRYGLNKRLPEAYKRRDPKEPKREEKEMWEDKLAKEMRRRFRAQLKQIEKQLQVILPPRKSKIDDYMALIPDGAFQVPKSEKKLLQILIQIAGLGVDLFAEEIGLDIDWTSVKDQASAWAQTYTTEWLSGLDDTSRKRIRTEVGNFIEQKGYTIGDVMDGLKDSGFDADRAQRIATTEVTRVYGESAEIAARQLQDEFPDLDVTKTWFTNRDGLVCSLCGPLHNVTVGAGESFGAEPGVQSPPIHPNCRCWITYSTHFLDESERGEYLPRD